MPLGNLPVKYHLYQTREHILTIHVCRYINCVIQNIRPKIQWPPFYDFRVFQSETEEFDDGNIYIYARNETSTVHIVRYITPINWGIKSYYTFSLNGLPSIHILPINWNTQRFFFRFPQVLDFTLYIGLKLQSHINPVASNFHKKKRWIH